MDNITDHLAQIAHNLTGSRRAAVHLPLGSGAMVRAPSRLGLLLVLVAIGSGCGKSGTKYSVNWGGSATLRANGTEQRVFLVGAESYSESEHTYLSEKKTLKIEIRPGNEDALGFECLHLEMDRNAPLSEPGELAITDFRAFFIGTGDVDHPRTVTELPNDEWAATGKTNVTSYKYHEVSEVEDCEEEHLDEEAQGTFNVTLTGPGGKTIVLKDGTFEISIMRKSPCRGYIG